MSTPLQIPSLASILPAQMYSPDTKHIDNVYNSPATKHHYCNADEFVTVNVPDSASKPGIIIASSLEEHVVGWTRYHFSSSLLLQTNEPETL